MIAAPAARAQVAFAPVVQADDAVHRDIVGQIALAMAAEHAMLSPQLSERDVAPCRDDVKCLIDVARRQGASHLVIVSVGPLGTRDQVVAASLHAVGSGASLFEENAVLSTTRDVRDEARAIGVRMAAVQGPPAVIAVAQDEPPPQDITVLSIVGLGVLAGGGATALGTGVASSLALSGTNPEPRSVGPIIVVGAIAAGVLAAGGLTLLVVDSF